MTLLCTTLQTVGALPPRVWACRRHSQCQCGCLKRTESDSGEQCGPPAHTASEGAGLRPALKVAVLDGAGRSAAHTFYFNTLYLNTSIPQYTGTGGVKVAASSRNGGKRQRRLNLRLTLRRRTDRQQRPATTTARSTCFCPGCCRMTSTNWSISERTVRTGFRALQGTREAKSSGVLLPSMHPRCVSEGVSVSAIECRLVQPAAGESVGVAPHRRCTVRNGAGLRPALKVKVWAAQPAPRASVRCPLPPSVVWEPRQHP